MTDQKTRIELEKYYLYSDLSFVETREKIIFDIRIENAKIQHIKQLMEKSMERISILKEILSKLDENYKESTISLSNNLE